MEVDGAEDGYLSYGMLQEGQVPGRAEETRRGRELRSANTLRSVSLVWKIHMVVKQPLLEELISLPAQHLSTD